MTEPRIPLALAQALNVKRFSGNYLLYRKAGGGMVRATSDGGGGKRDRNGHPPRFRHPDYASAEREASRLLKRHPQSTFLILQEVGRVKAATIVANDEPAASGPEAA